MQKGAYFGVRYADNPICILAFNSSRRKCHTTSKTGIFFYNKTRVCMPWCLHVFIYIWDQYNDTNLRLLLNLIDFYIMYLFYLFFLLIFFYICPFHSLSLFLFTHTKHLTHVISGNKDWTRVYLLLLLTHTVCS